MSKLSSWGFVKKGVRVKTGQVWTIGKGTQTLVKESNNLDYDIGNEVEIMDIFRGDSLILVQDRLTGTKFDARLINLGKLVLE